MDVAKLDAEYRQLLTSFIASSRKSRKITVGSLAVLALFISNSEKVAWFLGTMETRVVVVLLALIVFVGLVLERLYDVIEQSVAASQRKPVTDDAANEHLAVLAVLVSHTEPLGEKFGRAAKNKKELPTASTPVTGHEKWKTAMFFVRVITKFWLIQLLLALIDTGVVLYSLLSGAGFRG